jgi:hypothetical protein
MPAHVNHNQFTSPLPPTEVFSLQKDEMLAINPAMPLFGPNQEGQRNNGLANVIADFTVHEPFSADTAQLSFLEFDLPLPNGEGTVKTLFLSRVTVADTGKQQYLKEHTINVRPDETGFTERHIKALGLSGTMVDSVYFERDASGTLFVRNNSDKMDLSVTAQTSAAWKPFEADPTPTTPDIEEGFSADYTMNAKEAARMHGLYNPDTNMFGKEGGKLRKVIDRNTPSTEIDGMVDIRPWLAGDEALVIDSQEPEHAEEYKNFLNQFNDRLRRLPELTERGIIESIKETVRDAMAYDLGFTSQISDEVKTKSAGQRKVNLALYLRAKRGVCRQMALAEAWLAGEATKGGLLSGVFTAEVNEVYERGGHEWGRYTPADVNSEPLAVDAAQNFVGTLSESLQDNINGQNRWEYFRPGEKASYRQRLLGRQAAANADTVPRFRRAS